VAGVCIVVLAIVVASSASLQSTFPEKDPATSSAEYTQMQLGEDMLHEAHDELIMLIIALVVVIQVTASYKFFRWLPNRLLLICSFGGVALSAFCTVVEGFVFQEVLNYVEHLSFMTAAILIAVWCGLWAFGPEKQGGS